MIFLSLIYNNNNSLKENMYLRNMVVMVGFLTNKKHAEYKVIIAIIIHQTVFCTINISKDLQFYGIRDHLLIKLYRRERYVDKDTCTSLTAICIIYIKVYYYRNRCYAIFTHWSGFRLNYTRRLMS